MFDVVDKSHGTFIKSKLYINQNERVIVSERISLNSNFTPSNKLCKNNMRHTASPNEFTYIYILNMKIISRSLKEGRCFDKRLVAVVTRQ